MDRFILFIDLLAYMTAIVTGILVFYEVFAKGFFRYITAFVFVVSLAWALSGLN